MNRYDDAHMTGAHLDREVHAAERMTQEQRDALIDRLQYENARERYQNDEARIAAEVARGVEASLAANQQLYARSIGVASSGDNHASSGNASFQSTAFAPLPPQALLDSLPVTIGGIQLGPQQAAEMHERGEISARQYEDALNAALQPYGYRVPSFR